MNLSDKEFVDQYQKKGFLCPLPAIGKEMAAKALEKIQEVEATNGGKWPNEYALKPHLVYPFLDEIIRQTT